MRDLKRIVKRGKDIQKLENLVGFLQQGESLPSSYIDHKLKGKWAAHRECHIEPDWLLIYRIDREYLILERTGSHSDLFES